MLDAPEDLHALTRTGVLPVSRRHGERARHRTSHAAPSTAVAAEQQPRSRRTAVPVLPAPQPSPGGYGLDLGAAAGPWLVTHVRRRVANVALGHGASPDESLVIELLTSELVTNAVVHGPDEAHVGVRTAYQDGAFSVAVTDRGTGLPVLRDPHPTELSGRGLHVVANLASTWGIDPGTAGKTVWFTVELARGVDRGSRHP
ncbi:ATP-binding protein [Cellulomonas sp. NS3]|uniref:ATP-binding protein n=1 Tax=Cellulomonas sp. NS3 TaxID=2973977 RepID=UPI002161B75E|nr:ATP-binding protein [Cellulomonas sp. NS3]